MIPKIKILKKMKKIAGDIIFLYMHVYHKWRYDTWLLKYKVPQTEIFVILGHLLPFQPEKLKNWKKNTWTYHFTHLHHKWRSYDMYGSWDMESNRQNFLLFWNVYHKWKSYDVWFLRYGAQQTDRQKKWHIEVSTPPKNSRKTLLSSKMLITSCVNRWCQLRGKAEKCPVLSTWVCWSGRITLVNCRWPARKIQFAEFSILLMKRLRHVINSIKILTGQLLNFWGGKTVNKCEGKKWTEKVELETSWLGSACRDKTLHYWKVAPIL